MRKHLLWVHILSSCTLSCIIVVAVHTVYMHMIIWAQYHSTAFVHRRLLLLKRKCLITAKCIVVASTVTTTWQIGKKNFFDLREHGCIGPTYNYQYSSNTNMNSKIRWTQMPKPRRKILLDPFIMHTIYRFNFSFDKVLWECNSWIEAD